MDHLSIMEKAKWVADRIFMELERLEKETGAYVDDVKVSRVGKRITSVNIDIYRSLEDGTR